MYKLVVQKKRKERVEKSRKKKIEITHPPTISPPRGVDHPSIVSVSGTFSSLLRVLIKNKSEKSTTHRTSVFGDGAGKFPSWKH